MTLMLKFKISRLNWRYEKLCNYKIGKEIYKMYLYFLNYIKLYQN